MYDFASPPHSAFERDGRCYLGLDEAKKHDVFGLELGHLHVADED